MVKDIDPSLLFTLQGLSKEKQAALLGVAKTMTG